MYKQKSDGRTSNRSLSEDSGDVERTEPSLEPLALRHFPVRRGDSNCSRMGVQSLTTYVKKNNLGTYVYLPDPLGERGLPLIVDGMAWAYNVGLVDTFQGGSYAAIRANTRRYVEYWRACGLEPEVVWDGASTPFFP